MKKNILILGGDNRNIELAKLLKEDGYIVNEYGIEKSEVIITSTPFTIDNENIYCITKDKININEFINSSKGKLIFGGKISSQYIELLNKNNNKVIDIMKSEELAIKNAIPTAEGVIKLIIENTDITINESNIAVLGFGRVGKQISKVLKSLGANMYIYEIKKEEVANIRLASYNIINEINDDLGKMDIIVNTVPSKILNKQELEHINKNTLIIDVSSKPGGVDFEYAKSNNYKVIHELGIPGKIAPKTSAIYIKEFIEKNI